MGKSFGCVDNLISILNVKIFRYQGLILSSKESEFGKPKMCYFSVYSEP